MKIGACLQLKTMAFIWLAACCAMTGCKSMGNWVPKMPWNREPSSATLAGGNTPKLPESPATKYTPNAIASVGAGTTSSPTSGSKSNIYGNAGQTSPGTSGSAPGMAANANGYQNSYQTGPYQTGPYQTGNASGSKAATTPGSNLASSYPSPYAGSYTGVVGGQSGSVTKGNLVGTSNTVPGSSTSGSVAPIGYSEPPTSYAQPGYPAPNTAAPPTGYPTVNYPTANTQTSVPNNSGYPAGPGDVSYPSLPPLPSASVGGATGEYSQTSGVATPSSSVPSNVAPAQYNGGYQPGSTSRATKYSFGTPSGNPSSPSNSYTLPPNTASGAGPGSTNPNSVLR